MQIYYAEVSLAEGFELSDKPKEERLVKGKQISICSGYQLFSSLRHQPIKCWHCSCVADRWISTIGQNDIRNNPVLNLYGITKHGKLRLMTRDHIIPKSLGGVDDIQNLRPGCDVCNGERANHMSKADREFMLANPHLISEERRLKGLAAREANEARMREAAALKLAAAIEQEQLLNDIQPFNGATHAVWEQMVGTKVIKRTGKPFKSALKVNTVKAMLQHPYTPHKAFSFHEDNSLVECFRCIPAPEGAEPEESEQT